MNVTLFEIHVNDATFSPTSSIGGEESRVDHARDAGEAAESGRRRTGRAALSAVLVVAGVGAGLVAVRRFRTRDAGLDEDHEEISIDDAGEGVQHAPELAN